jgi:hypothetical protein
MLETNFSGGIKKTQMDTNKRGSTDLGIYKNTRRYEKHAGE